MIDYRVLAFDREIVAQGRYGIDADMVVGADAARFPMLGHVLPYEDTRFHRSQVRALVGELDRLPADHRLPPDLRTDLRALCEVVLAEVHHQLWFIGD